MLPWFGRIERDDVELGAAAGRSAFSMLLVEDRYCRVILEANSLVACLPFIE